MDWRTRDRRRRPTRDTLAFDPYDESLFVASFTLNHIVRLRLHEKRKAQYKVFVSGQDVDSPVGMVLDDGVLYVSSFTNDHVLRVGAQNGSLLGKFGNEDELDCPEGLSLGPDGSIYVASFLLKHIARYEPRSGRYLGAFAPARDGSYEVSPSGALRWVASASAAEPPPLLGAEDLAFDHNGDLHVTAYWSNAYTSTMGRRARSRRRTARASSTAPSGSPSAATATCTWPRTRTTRS